MIGGIIIGLVRQAGSTLAHVQDRNDVCDICAVRLREVRRDDGMPVQMELGDGIWWQGPDCMWTPEGVVWNEDPEGCRKRWDIHLPRIGYSH